jgi:hypothetical protein
MKRDKGKLKRSKHSVRQEMLEDGFATNRTCYTYVSQRCKRTRQSNRDYYRYFALMKTWYVRTFFYAFSF